MLRQVTTTFISETAPPNRRMYLASLNREFNDVICIDHKCLDTVTIFHMMDVA